jgi:hypothetical protein
MVQLRFVKDKAVACGATRTRIGVKTERVIMDTPTNPFHNLFFYEMINSTIRLMAITICIL